MPRSTLHETVLPFPADAPLTDDLLEQLGELAPRHLIERGPDGELIVTPNGRVGGGRIRFEMGRQILNWIDAVRDEGEVDGAVDGFIVDDGRETRQAGGSYFTAEQVRRMPLEGIDAGFPHEVPTFAFEVRTKSQSLAERLERCRMWVERGVKVAWMIDAVERRVHVFRAGPESAERSAVVHDRPDAIEIGPELPGLVIDFRPIWRS